MRWAVGLVIAHLLVAAGRIEANLVVWELTAGGNGHAYELVDEPLPWHGALAAAANRSTPDGFGTGHLATISDADENEFLFTTFAMNLSHGFWMGFTDEAVEGEWRWIDDTPGIWQDPDDFAEPIQTAFTNWGGIDPNDFLGEDAAGMNGGVDTWNDGQVVTPRVYVVEWEPPLTQLAGDTNSDGIVDITDVNNVLNNFRLGELGGPPIPGDAFPFDGVVDLGDLNLVRNYFGTSVPVAVVPEPGAGLLMVAGFLFFVSRGGQPVITGTRIRVATVLRGREKIT